MTSGRLLGYVLAALAIADAAAAVSNPAVVVRKHKNKGSDEPSPIASAIIGGQTFVNKGIVAFGLIPSDARDSTGDTIGGIGSAIAIQPGSWNPKSDGTFTGKLIVQPDRGYNIITTVDYQARQHEIDFTLTPYYDAGNLTFKQSQKTLGLSYQNTLLYKGPNGMKTSGLDALNKTVTNPPLPLPNSTYQHVSFDCEGLVLNNDGTFWSSDEYGPYVYRIDARGNALSTLAPPAAILPYENGVLNFTASVDPTTGRAANQGFEGLTASPDGSTLYALLQSATIQDGGSGKSTNRYTRLLAYSVASTPKLIGEYVVPLPQSTKGKTYAQSEVHYLSNTTFLVLARDGNGNGDDNTLSSYKQADLFSIANATNIAGSAFDAPSAPLAPNGVLNKTVTPATYASFVSYIDGNQLARFALHNGGNNDSQLINPKWESLALAPVGDKAYPDDYFLFTASDNDFQTTKGVSVGQPYDAGISLDSQFLVFRVTLPTVIQGSLARLYKK